MTDIFCYILLFCSAAFLAAMALGKSSKDEPLPPIEEWEDVYTNPKYSRWEK